MSFVRSGREIDTVDAFPKVDREETGDWPLLQSYAYYWAAEVQFEPAIDDALGIGHDKQTVEPIVDFWKVLKQATVNAALKSATRKRAKEGKDHQRDLQELPEADQPAVTAANEAAKSERPVVPGSKKMKEKQEKEGEQKGRKDQEKAELQTGPGQKPAAEPADSETTETPDSEAAEPQPLPVAGGAVDGRFGIFFFEAEGGVFMDPRPGKSGRVEAWINRKHPWYESYANASTALEARNATNLLLLALAEAEIRATEEELPLIEGLRCDSINPFLRKSARILKSILPQAEEEADEEGVEIKS
jgi:hypothetical protein